MLQPNILKIDLNILKKSRSHRGYRAVMRSFPILASQLGASLLVEGVETKEDLHLALQAGARYVQGFLFSPAVAEFLPALQYAELLEKCLSGFAEKELAKYANITTIENKMENILAANHRNRRVESAEVADQLIEGLISVFQGNCIRIYVCKKDGKQLSSNFIRNNSGMWIKDPSYRGCNWIWRPYFISNIALMDAKGKGILSTEYTDLETSEIIQTYSYPLGDNAYVFLDLLI